MRYCDFSAEHKCNYEFQNKQCKTHIYILYNFVWLQKMPSYDGLAFTFMLLLDWRRCTDECSHVLQLDWPSSHNIWGSSPFCLPTYLTSLLHHEHAHISLLQAHLAALLYFVYFTVKPQLSNTSVTPKVKIYWL